MSLIQWPFKRKSYDGIVNPLFVSDTQSANEAVLDAVTAVTGLSGSGFAIITGLNYITGAPNTYSPGIIWFNGTFYYVAAAFNEGSYLAINPTDIMPTLFATTPPVTNNIYTVQYAVPSATSAGNTPVFTGNMNQYRISLSYFQSAVAALQTIASALGTAANADLGTGTGQILTADETYTNTVIDLKLADKSPSYVGEVKEILPLSSGANTTFLALFNGSGEGISYPWVGWHLLNGNDGYPDMTGRKFVGAGTGYVYNTQGGAATITLTTDNIPPLVTDDTFLTAPGTGVTGITSNNPGSGKGSIGVNAGSPTTPVSIEDSYMPCYLVYRHT